jgi:hypothetical protein
LSSAAFGGVLEHRASRSGCTSSRATVPYLSIELSGLSIRSSKGETVGLTRKDVTSIVCRCDDVDQVVTREGGTWVTHTAGPAAESLPADISGALDLATTVGRARAEAWVAEADDATFGLGGPGCRLTLDYFDPEDAGARTVTLAFGKLAPGGVYASRSGDPAVFVAPASLRKAVARWLVDRSAFRVFSSQATANGPSVSFQDPREGLAQLTAHLASPIQWAARHGTAAAACMMVSLDPWLRGSSPAVRYYEQGMVFTHAHAVDLGVLALEVVVVPRLAHLPLRERRGHHRMAPPIFRVPDVSADEQAWLPHALFARP